MVAYALRTRAPLSLPRRGDPVRLACIRPAASVHPEPGSNSSLYYCCTFLFPVLGLRYDSLLFLTLETVRASRLTASDLCWPQAFKELFDLPFLLPLFRVVENGCKGTTFFHSRKSFFTFFSKNFLDIDYQYFIKTKKRLIVANQPFVSLKNSIFFEQITDFSQQFNVF